MGRGQPPDQRGELRPAARAARWRTSATAAVRPGLLHRRAPRRTAASLRVYTETAWASIFARNLFRRPTARGARGFAPNFTIIDVPGFEADPATEGTRTGTAILVHLKRMEIIIVGTEYAGEIKKSRVHGHELPDARRGRAADALLDQRRARPATRASSSASRGPARRPSPPIPLRSLIGDDEHGWGDGYTFNFEGGCYAKTIRLSPMYEPDIFATTKRFGTILENVDIDPLTRELDLDSERFTENTRARVPAPLHRQRRPDRHRRRARGTSCS